MTAERIPSVFTKPSAVKKYARTLMKEGREASPHGFKLTQIGEDFIRMVERHTRVFIEEQIQAQRRQKRLGDPLADLTPGQRAAMKPRKRRRA